MVSPVVKEENGIIMVNFTVSIHIKSRMDDFFDELTGCIVFLIVVHRKVNETYFW